MAEALMSQELIQGFINELFDARRKERAANVRITELLAHNTQIAAERDELQKQLAELAARMFPFTEPLPSKQEEHSFLRRLPKLNRRDDCFPAL